MIAIFDYGAGNLRIGPKRPRCPFSVASVSSVLSSCLAFSSVSLCLCSEWSFRCPHMLAIFDYGAGNLRSVQNGLVARSLWSLSPLCSLLVLRFPPCLCASVVNGLFGVPIC
jgi:hypothetical protein